MAVTIICPNLKCRTILQVPDGVRGKKVRCSKCGKNFLVPAATQTKRAASAADDQGATVEQ